MLNNDIKPFSLQMSHDERKHPWLPLLLDCYALIDFSVAKAIEQSARNVSCHKGCSACCWHVMPLSAIECIGIKFYTQNILVQQHKAIMSARLNENNTLYLFNIDDCCSTYSLRSIACRRYIVYSTPCKVGKNPLAAISANVLEASREYLYQAIEMTLPFYKDQTIPFRDDEHIFEFYKRRNVELPSVYANIMKDI